MNQPGRLTWPGYSSYLSDRSNSPAINMQTRPGARRFPPLPSTARLHLTRKIFRKPSGCD